MWRRSLPLATRAAESVHSLGLSSLFPESAGRSTRPRGAARGRAGKGGASRGRSMDAHKMRGPQRGVRVAAKHEHSCGLSSLSPALDSTPVVERARGAARARLGRRGVERQIGGRACGALVAGACGGVWGTGVMRTREA